MKKTLLALLIISLISCRQKKYFDCKAILDKAPYFVRNSSLSSKDSIEIDRQILKECGSLDSIDFELTNGPFLGTLLIKHVSENKQITYRAIINSIEEFKKTPIYAQFREATIVSKNLETKIVNMNDWEKDKLLFLAMGMSAEQLSEFKDFLQKNENQKLNYKTALTNFTSLREPESMQTTERLKGLELMDLDNALKAGRESGKNILIEFTGYACVNSRKMEDNILTDPGVKELISKNYVYFSAYCDNGRPDPENNSSTIGKKYCKIQSEKFKSSSQPTFYLLDTNGKIIAETMYTPGVEKFKEFLTKGLK